MEKEPGLKGSYFCTLVVFQVISCLMQLAAFGLLTYIRIESDLELFKNVWYLSFAITTLVGMNAGSFVLCFRRKKYVCLSFLCELASLVLFAIQIYLFIEEGTLVKNVEKKKADLRILVFISSGLVLGRLLLFIFQIFFILFRLKY